MSFPGFLFATSYHEPPYLKSLPHLEKQLFCHQKPKEAERYQQLLQDPEVQPLVKQILKYKKCLKLPILGGWYC